MSLKSYKGEVEAYPSFCSMATQYFYYPLSEMLVTPSTEFAGTHLYTWPERDILRVKCPSQEHNTISPARVPTRIACPDTSALTMTSPCLLHTRGTSEIWRRTAQNKTRSAIFLVVRFVILFYFIFMLSVFKGFLLLVQRTGQMARFFWRQDTV